MIAGGRTLPNTPAGIPEYRAPAALDIAQIIAILINKAISRMARSNKP